MDSGQIVTLVASIIAGVLLVISEILGTSNSTEAKSITMLTSNLIKGTSSQPLTIGNPLPGTVLQSIVVSPKTGD